MNGEQNSSDVFLTFNGNVIAGVESISINKPVETLHPNRTIENGESLNLFNREFSVTVDNVTVSDDFIGMMIPSSQRFTLVGTGYKYPRGNKLPKKKRIRNKWIKKYQHGFTLEDCTLL